MARLDLENLEKITKERPKVHERVKATYSVFSEDGTKYFQLDTYGRSERKVPEKISQIIQMDETDAREIINILRTVFNIE